MDTTKHTPGPWVVHATEVGVNAIDAVRSPGDTSTRVAYFRPTYRPTEADARLIAAAPELLEALAAHVAWYDGKQIDEAKLMASSRAALAKARGEQ